MAFGAGSFEQPLPLRLSIGRWQCLEQLLFQFCQLNVDQLRQVKCLVLAFPGDDGWLGGPAQFVGRCRKLWLSQITGQAVQQNPANDFGFRMRQFARRGKPKLVATGAVLLKLNGTKVCSTPVSLMTIGTFQGCGLAPAIQKLWVQVSMMTEPDRGLIDRLALFVVGDQRSEGGRCRFTRCPPDGEFGMGLEVAEIQLESLRDLVRCPMAVGAICIGHLGEQGMASVFLVTTGAADGIELWTQQLFQRLPGGLIGVRFVYGDIGEFGGFNSSDVIGIGFTMTDLAFVVGCRMAGIVHRRHSQQRDQLPIVTGLTVLTEQSMCIRGAPRFKGAMISQQKGDGGGDGADGKDDGQSPPQSSPGIRVAVDFEVIPGCDGFQESLISHGSRSSQ